MKKRGKNQKKISPINEKRVNITNRIQSEFPWLQFNFVLKKVSLEVKEKKKNQSGIP